jgi:hypothetical protein
MNSPGTPTITLFTREINSRYGVFPYLGSDFYFAPGRENNNASKPLQAVEGETLFGLIDHGHLVATAKFVGFGEHSNRIEHIFSDEVPRPRRSAITRSFHDYGPGNAILLDPDSWQFINPGEYMDGEHGNSYAYWTSTSFGYERVIVSKPRVST